jgi:hypothetical protein
MRNSKRLTRSSLPSPGQVVLREGGSSKRCGESPIPEPNALCLERFEHFLALVEQGITQAARRVLEGEQLPATEKILSLFEEHTQIISRKKMGKPREFGRKVLLDEVDGGIVSRYEILEEVGREHPCTYPPV